MTSTRDWAQRPRPPRVLAVAPDGLPPQDGVRRRFRRDPPDISMPPSAWVAPASRHRPRPDAIQAPHPAHVEPAAICNPGASTGWP